MAGLDQSIQFVKGVGPRRAKLLEKLGIKKIEDLLYHIPRQYRDRSQIKKINEVEPGLEITVAGVVKARDKIRTRSGRNIFKVAFSDETGIAYATWFDQPFIFQKFSIGQEVLVSGKISDKSWEQGKRVEFIHPNFELGGEGGLHSGRIVPLYPLTEGLNQNQFRRWVNSALEEYSEALREFLPEEILKENGWPEREKAIWEVHFPSNSEIRKKAFERLVFEELLLFQIKLAQKQSEKKQKPGYCHEASSSHTNRLMKSLPFALTSSQKRVWEEIKDDMEKPEPMSRLLQGDVGAGKTVIALLALLKTVENGWQGAFMAPTEILAEQHFYKMEPIFREFGLKTLLLTGSLSVRDKKRNYREISSGEADIIVGTHALIQEGVKFSDLAMVVIDEQHRFGVQQREALLSKGKTPDLLVMTATPIPRSLALTLYGDLEVSVIDELPTGRKPIITRARKTSARSNVYKFIREQVAKGRQAFIVCPLIQESEKLQLVAAEDMFRFLKQEIFPDLELMLIHGQVPAAQRAEAMKNFKDGKIDIMVSTTVIEVGVDIPNATIMLIEDAHRFGLSQLHQLRGRVGRGAEQSYCILMSDAEDELAKQRLNALVKNNDGFMLAEEDLRLRGAGDFFGTRQHGITPFRFADLVTHQKILRFARKKAGLYLQLIRESEKRFPGDIIR